MNSAGNDRRSPPPIERGRDTLWARVAAWKRAGGRVAVVPTMGALHAGHLSLVEAAARGCDRVIVTIFVNPKQFNNAADLGAYPRSEADDAAKLAALPVDVIYAPTPDQIYPEGFATTVSVAGVSEGLCGAGRPGHFDGVATVVTKLLTQTGADRAYFGEKDYQQLQVVKRLVRDLDIRAEIVACPTVREDSGLALSSRNRRLTPHEHRVAAALYAELNRTAERMGAGTPVAAALAQGRAALVRAGFCEVEYLELRAADTLAPASDLARPARLLAAVHLGAVRLIDNIAVG